MSSLLRADHPGPDRTEPVQRPQHPDQLVVLRGEHVHGGAHDVEGTR